MELETRRRLFVIIWFFVVLSGPLTVFRFTSFSDIFSNSLVLTNAFQRITGLIAFSLLSIQIIIGSSMGRFVQVIGARAYRVHITQGLLAYGFAFIHPIFYYLLNYKATGKILFFPNLTDPIAQWITFGRISLSLLTITVIASYFRTKPYFRRNWKMFHIINYLIFYIVSVHYWYVGTDAGFYPFVWVFWLSFSAVNMLVLNKLFLFVKDSGILGDGKRARTK